MADRCAVLVGSSVKTKHDHSRLAYSRVGGHGGRCQMKWRHRSTYGRLCAPLWREIRQCGDASLGVYGFATPGGRLRSSRHRLLTASIPGE